MVKEVLTNYSHPILGEFKRTCCTNHVGKTFYDFRKEEKIEIPGLGLVFHGFHISLTGQSEPPDKILSEFLNIINWPRSRAFEVKQALFDFYMEERKDFIEWADDSESLAACKLETPDEVWSTIRKTYVIGGGNFAQHPYISFDCVFESEHGIHISFFNNKVADVWNE